MMYYNPVSQKIVEEIDEFEEFYVKIKSLKEIETLEGRNKILKKAIFQYIDDKKDNITFISVKDKGGLRISTNLGGYDETILDQSICSDDLVEEILSKNKDFLKLVDYYHNNIIIVNTSLIRDSEFRSLDLAIHFLNKKDIVIAIGGVIIDSEYFHEDKVKLKDSIKDSIAAYSFIEKNAEKLKFKDGKNTVLRRISSEIEDLNENIKGAQIELKILQEKKDSIVSELKANFSDEDLLLMELNSDDGLLS